MQRVSDGSVWGHVRSAVGCVRWPMLCGLRLSERVEERDGSALLGWKVQHVWAGCVLIVSGRYVWQRLWTGSVIVQWSVRQRKIRQLNRAGDEPVLRTVLGGVCVCRWIDIGDGSCVRAW